MVLLRAILATWIAGLATTATANPLYKDSIDASVKGSNDRKLPPHIFSPNLTAQIVKNPGLCETTPGVNSYTGYIDVGKDQNIFFWFFEARKVSPQKAPLALWLNGGPGCSSMFGLFQENGPCRLESNDSEPDINPWSFNTHANVLYVDQPVGTGYSYGNSTGNTTFQTTAYLWKFMQAFYARFPEYVSEDRNFGIFSESYGGHYGPVLSEYILYKNDEIRDGRLVGAQKINLVALAVNNGLFNHLVQTKGMIEFMYKNPYRQLINESSYRNATEYWNRLCEPQRVKCLATDSDEDCKVPSGCFDIAWPEDAIHTSFYDIRRDKDDDPPELLSHYLNEPHVLNATGAKGPYVQCREKEFGDSWEPDTWKSTGPCVSKTVSAGVKTLLYFGDADQILQHMGGLDVANNIHYKQQAEFVATQLSPFTVNGKEHGLWKNVGNLSYMRVYNAGHYVPYNQPELTLQILDQMLRGENPSPT